MTEPLDDEIRQAAAGPKSASDEKGSFSAHSLKDQIEADRYLEAKRAARRGRPGVRLTPITPPGA